MTLLAILSLGFFLGMRHATDADHVVAVTTIVSKRRTTRAAMLVGALWGIGHTMTILLVGGAIVVFGLVIPPRLGLSMEFSVAVMLVVLGAMNIVGARQHMAAVARGDSAEGDVTQPVRGMAKSMRLRPVVVGVVHGLAGSAAVALLVLATIRDAIWALLYLAVFGAGTVAGMMLLTTALAVPFAAASRRFESFHGRLAALAGVVSIVFGLGLAYQIGIVDGLFSSTVVWRPQ